jgi:putative ABC transport system permease protein
MILGAKGSKLQLVLNTIYHLSSPVENIPWSYYKEFRPGGKYAAQVQTAIPYCLGDNYENYRVVGTIPQMFEIDYAAGQSYRFAAGRNFEDDHFNEAVVGALAARNTGLTIGSEFQPTHGVSGSEGHKHDAFKVVGILAPTGTPNDRALFVNIEGFYLLSGHAREVEPAAKARDDHDHEHVEKSGERKAESGTSAAAKKAVDDDHDHPPGDKHVDDKHADDKHVDMKPADDKPAAHVHDEHGHDHDHEHDHAHHHHEPLPENQREVTAILIRTNNPLWNPYIYKAVNKGQVAQAVFPASEIYQLFQGIVGNLEWLLLLLAGLVVVVAGIGVMVSIYNSMNDRRREIAIMRSLGASRQTVLAIILLESILLALGGGGAGFLLGHALLGVLSPLIVAHTGVSIGLFQFDGYELILIPGLIALASLVGYLPGLAAYRTDVAKALAGSDK